MKIQTQLNIPRENLIGGKTTLFVIFEAERLVIKLQNGPLNDGFYLNPYPNIDTNDDGWSGWYGGLLDFFLNDGLDAPVQLTSILRRLWIRWDEGRVDEAEAQKVLDALFEWVDAVNAAYPKEVLRKYR